MKRFNIFMGTIYSTTIEANNRKEAIEKALELNEVRVEEVSE